MDISQGEDVEKIVKNIQNGKFEDLAQRFKKLELKDVLEMDQKTFLDQFALEEKIRGLALYNALSSLTWTEENPQNQKEEKKNQKEEKKFMEKIIINFTFLNDLKNEEIANLEKKVVDDQFSMFSTADRPPLSSALNELIGSNQTIRVLKLGFNNLGDRSLPILFKYCRKFPNLEYLDLFSNRISANAWSGLKALLELKNIKFINIAGNIIASADSKNFFEILPIELLVKLVWVPEHWINAKPAWTYCLGKRSYLASDIARIFFMFYSTLSDCKITE